MVVGTPNGEPFSAECTY